jgi:hypothetical protein
VPLSARKLVDVPKPAVRFKVSAEKDAVATLHRWYLDNSTIAVATSTIAVATMTRHQQHAECHQT